MEDGAGYSVVGFVGGPTLEEIDNGVAAVADEGDYSIDTPHDTFHTNDGDEAVEEHDSQDEAEDPEEMDNGVVGPEPPANEVEEDDGAASSGSDCTEESETDYGYGHELRMYIPYDAFHTVHHMFAEHLSALEADTRISEEDLLRWYLEQMDIQTGTDLEEQVSTAQVILAMYFPHFLL